MFRANPQNRADSDPRQQLGDGDESEQREARMLRQREASDVIGRLLAGIG